MNKFDKKDVISWANCEEAKKYIGEEGYFRDDFQEDLAAWYKGILQEIDPSLLVDCTFEDEENHVYGLFLPACKVKQQEPKERWRPFKNYTEFNSVVGVGIRDVLVYRFNGYGKDVTLVGVIDGFRLSAEGDEIIIAGIRFTLEELFIHYTWKDSKDNWHKFGVEE